MVPLCKPFLALFSSARYLSGMTEENSRPRGAYLAGVDRLGDVWGFLILREAFFGARRFGDFAAALKISRARLSERLSHFVEADILEKRPGADGASRQEYRLTQKGIAIYPIALAMIDWAIAWRQSRSVARLVHRPCGAPLRIGNVCRSCGDPVHRDHVAWPEVIPLDGEETGSNVRGWRRMASFDGVSARPDPAMDALKAFGDRWSMLIVYGAQRGPFRFGDALAALGVSTNILSDRLKHLSDEGLLTRTKVGREAIYRLTPAGEALMDCVLSIRSWAVDWESPGPGGWSLARHKTCGAHLLTDAVCKTCGQPVKANEIDFSTPSTATVEE